MVKILVAFSEYLNFNSVVWTYHFFLSPFFFFSIGSGLAKAFSTIWEGTWDFQVRCRHCDVTTR